MYSVLFTYRGDRARGADGARSPAARAQAAPVYRGTLTPSTLRWSTRLPVIRIELVLFLPAKQRTFKNDCKLNSLFITYFRSYFYCPKKLPRTVIVRSASQIQKFKIHHKFGLFVFCFLWQGRKQKLCFNI